MALGAERGAGGLGGAFRMLTKFNCYVGAWGCPVLVEVEACSRGVSRGSEGAQLAGVAWQQETTAALKLCVCKRGTPHTVPALPCSSCAPRLTRCRRRPVLQPPQWPPHPGPRHTHTLLSALVPHSPCTPFLTRRQRRPVLQPPGKVQHESVPFPVHPLAQDSHAGRSDPSLALPPAHAFPSSSPRCFYRAAPMLPRQTM